MNVIVRIFLNSRKDIPLIALKIVEYLNLVESYFREFTKKQYSLYKYYG